MRGPLIESVSSIVVSDSNMFLGTETQGIFRSPDLGRNWTTVNNGLTTSWIIALISSGNNLIAGSYQNGIFRSSDHGSTWISVPIDLKYSKTVLCFASDSADLFAGTFLNGVFRSIDHGATWTAVNHGLQDSSVKALCINGTKMFAGTRNGVSRSTDRGANWTAVSSGLTNAEISALTIVDSTVLAGTSTGMFRSVDDGEHWTEVNTGLQYYYHVRSFVVSGSTVYSGANGAGVLKSTDQGETWTQCNSGLRDTYITTLSINGNTIYAGTSSSIYAMTVGDTVWKEISTRLSSSSLYSIAAAGKNIYVGTGSQGIFRSTDDGASWKTSNDGFPDSQAWSLFIRDSMIFAGTSAGAFRSTDNGNHWTKANDGLPGTYYVEEFAALGTAVFAVASDGLYRSLNNGDQWSRIRPDVLQNGTSIAVSGGNLVAVTPDSLIISTTNGDNWQGINFGLPGEKVNRLAGDGKKLYAMTSAGSVIRSVDNGLTWKKTGETALAGPICAADSVLFMNVHWGGIYRSIDQGKSWALISSDLKSSEYDALYVSDSHLFTGFDVWPYIYFYGRPLSEVCRPVMKVSAPDSVIATALDYGVRIDIPMSADTALKGYRIYYRRGNSPYDMFLDIGKARTWNFTQTSITNAIAVSAYDAQATGNNDQDNGDESGFVAVIKHYCPTASAQSLSFGDVAVGDSAVQTIALRNPSALPTAVLSAGFRRGSFSLLKDITGTIPANNSITITTRFMPQQFGMWIDTLTIVTDVGIINIRVDGGSLAPAVLLADPNLNWGSVKVKQSASITLRVTNPSRNPLIIDSVVIKSRAFTIGDVKYPLSITVGDTASLAIQFSPDSVKAYADTMFFFRRNQTPVANVLKGTGIAGSGTEVGHDEHPIPTAYRLAQNYPNPFNPSTTFSFDLPAGSMVSLKIYDVLGREVADVVSEYLPAGSYARRWNGEHLESGMFFYRLQAGTFTETMKFLLIK